MRFVHSTPDMFGMWKSRKIPAKKGAGEPPPLPSSLLFSPDLLSRTTARVSKAIMPSFAVNT